MSADINDILLRVKTMGAKKAREELKAIGDSSNELGKKTEEHESAFSSFLGKASNVAAGATAAAGAAVLVEGVKSAVKFEAHERETLSNLEAMHENHHGNLSKMVKESERNSTSGGFSKEAEFVGMNKMLGVTHNVTKALEAHNDAVDLARSKGIELAKAETAVAQAEVGKTGRLQKMLGIIQPYTKYVTELSRKEEFTKGFIATDAEKKHAELLDQIKTREEALHLIESSGAKARAKYAQSLKGEWEDLKHTFENMDEALGKKVLPLIKDFFGFLAKHTTVLKILAGAIGAVVAVLDAYWVYQKLSKAATIVSTVATKAFRFALMEQTEQSKLAAVTEDLRSAALGEETVATDGATAASYAFDAANAVWIVGAMLLIGVVALIITHFQLFKQVAVDAFHWVENAAKTVWDWIKSNWPLLLDILLGPFGAAIGWVIQHFGEIKSTVENVFHDVLHFLESVPKKMEQIGEKIWKGLLAGAQWVIDKATAGINGLLKLINGMIGAYDKIPFAPHIGKIGMLSPPKLAEGGFINRGGFAEVGERGREIVALPGGASVIPLSGGGGLGKINLTVVSKLILNGKVAAEAIEKAQRETQARR